MDERAKTSDSSEAESPATSEDTSRQLERRRAVRRVIAAVPAIMTLTAVSLSARGSGYASGGPV